MASALPHTLDNLCKQDKDKVIEMLKQLNDLKKRCGALEQKLEAQILENQRLTGHDEVMTKQLEHTHTKLFEAVALSKESQNQIEQLSLRLQKTETEKKSLTLRLKELQVQNQNLKESILSLKKQHEKILVTAAVQSSSLKSDKGCNTDVSESEKTSVGVQVQMRFENLSNSVHETSEHSAEYQVEADEQLSELICILNS